MNHIVFLVEDLSTERFLEKFLVNFAENFTYEIISFQGKNDFMDRLPGYMAGYRGWVPENYKFLALCDRDLEDCRALKTQVQRIMSSNGFLPVSHNTVGGRSTSWIAIEEIEAWMLGDSSALAEAYPKMPDISKKSKFRDPDNISGGTWEALERELQSVGYYPAGLLKLELASKMGAVMRTSNNRSRSFQGFVNRIIVLST